MTLDTVFAPGSVEFDPGYKRSIVFVIAVAKTGPIEISGVAIDGLGSGWEQKLTFRFTVADSVRSALGKASGVADAFPSSMT